MARPYYNIIAFRFHGDPDPIKLHKVNLSNGPGRIIAHLRPKGIWYINFYGPVRYKRGKVLPETKMYSHREYINQNSPYNN